MGSEHPGVAPDPAALLPWLDLDLPARGNALAELEGANHAAILALHRGGVGDPRARWQFLNALDRVSDPAVRRATAAQFAAQTGESLAAFIETAPWHGAHDRAQARSLISPERDAAAGELAAMSPSARAALEVQAQGWAQRVLAVTRREGADSDVAAADIFRTLGPRSAVEVEAIRAAVRRNTGGRSIYEELDRALSGGTEAEALAGLSGDPVAAAWAGLRNADQPARIVEILRGLTAEQRVRFLVQQPMHGTGWILEKLPAGADRDEVRHLLGGRTAAADGVHLANLLRDPLHDAHYTAGIGGPALDAQSQRFAAARQPAQVIAELESRSPDEVVAAKRAWNETAVARGEPTWDALIAARFADGDPRTLMRLQALSRGERAESKALGLRAGLEQRDQGEIERVLANPDLQSTDPARRAAAERERQQIGEHVRALDAAEGYARAVMRGESPLAAQEAGRGVAELLAHHYAAETGRDPLEGRPEKLVEMMDRGNAVYADHVAATRDHRVGAEELWARGSLSTATQVHRAPDAEARAGLLEALPAAELATVRGELAGQYGEDALAERADAGALRVAAGLHQLRGDSRPLPEIEREVARAEMDAAQLRLANLRAYGAVPERRAELQVALQREQYGKQHSTALESEEAARAAWGGNAGTQDLARHQLAAAEDLLEPARDPFGVLPRELWSGVERAQFDALDRSLTGTLELQRAEKQRLADDTAQIFSTIAMIGSLMIAQPHLALLFDAALGLGKLAVKRQIAGEAYDSSTDVRDFATTMLMDASLVGAAQVGRLAAGAPDTARLAEHTATRITDHALTAEARGAAMESGLREASAASGVDVTRARIDQVTGVDKGADYAQFRDDMKAFYANQEIEAARAIPVRNDHFEATSVGPDIGWRSGFTCREFNYGDRILAQLGVDIRLTAQAGVDAAQLDLVKRATYRGVDDTVNFRAGKHLYRMPGARTLQVEPRFVDAPTDADHTVSVFANRVHPQTGTRVHTDMANWALPDILTPSAPRRGATTSAHEVGHMLGLRDEYEAASVIDRATANAPGVHADASVMANFHGRIDKDLDVGLEPRHLAELGARVDDSYLEADKAAEALRVSTAPTRRMQVVEAPGGPKTRGQPEDQLSAKGQNEPVPLTPAELHRVQLAQQGRNAYLKTAREPAPDGISAESARLLAYADAAIRDHMKPNDIAARLKENRGVQILRRDGRPFDHADEVENATARVVRTIRQIGARIVTLQRQQGPEIDIRALERRRSDLSRLLDATRGT